MQNKRTFASRFFELLHASLRLNTQRRSASSMCAFKKEEPRVQNVKTVQTIDITFCMHVKGPTIATSKKAFLSLMVCLFILFSFFAIRISRFLPLTFFVIRIFSIRIFLSAFSHPHPPSAGIRSSFYRHPHQNG